MTIKLAFVALFVTLASVQAQQPPPASPPPQQQPPPAPHDHHQQMTARGDQAMGFDQTKTTHHFYLYEDGGAIDVRAMSPEDKPTVDAIRTHLQFAITRFAAGDFTTPAFVHAQDVPGTATLARLRDRISYRFSDVPAGGLVRVSTRHVRALTAIHEFLRFQIQDHKTGDSVEIQRRQ